MIMRPWKKIKKLQHENEKLKESEETTKALLKQLAHAYEQADPAACLKEANNAYEQFLKVHVKVLDDNVGAADKLLKRLDEAKEDMEYLYKFLIVAGTRIGFLEGRLEKFAGGPSQLKIKELADAWNKYEKRLIP